MDIATCYKKQDKVSQYLDHAKKAIDAYCLAKRISSAANLAKDCAELLEENYNYEEAIALYERASELQ